MQFNYLAGDLTESVKGEQERGIIVRLLFGGADRRISLLSGQFGLRQYESFVATVNCMPQGERADFIAERPSVIERSGTRPRTYYSPIDRIISEVNLDHLKYYEELVKVTPPGQRGILFEAPGSGESEVEIVAVTAKAFRHAARLNVEVDKYSYGANRGEKIVVAYFDLIMKYLPTLTPGECMSLAEELRGAKDVLQGVISSNHKGLTEFSDLKLFVESIDAKWNSLLDALDSRAKQAQ